MQWVVTPGEIAWEIERSRFVGIVEGLRSPHDAEPLEQVRRRFADATHHCFAWRYGPLERAEDAGEPRGTAGRPLLELLKAHDVDRAIVIAVRYFGGIRLGRPGLYRAYAETGRRALQAAGLASPEALREVTMLLDYGRYQHWNAVLRTVRHETLSAEFGAGVRWHGRLSEDDWFRLTARGDWARTVQEDRPVYGVLHA